MGIICSRSDGVLDLSSFCFLPFAPKPHDKEGVQVASFLKSLTLEGEKKEKGGILGSIVAVFTCTILIYKRHEKKYFWIFERCRWTSCIGTSVRKVLHLSFLQPMFP